MKNNLKKEIRELLNPVGTKQDVLIVNDYNCDPGFYRHGDKIISKAELDELKKNYHNTVIFVRTKKDLTGGANVLNVTSQESAEKLKDFLIE